VIKSFRIKNLATIEEVELNMKKGFSIMTGETGAGKSIIIDGIRLVLGEKGSPDLIRTGKRETTVEAIFYVAPDKMKNGIGVIGMLGTKPSKTLEFNMGMFVRDCVSNFSGKGGGNVEYGQGFIENETLNVKDVITYINNKLDEM